jgi:hypothetical protein
MNRRPERLSDLLPDVVADLARRHQPPTLTNRSDMTAPDHGPFTNDLDAMTMDELLSLQRLLSHHDPDGLEAATREEIQYRGELRDQITGGAA